jgi:hypothetical protein
MKRYLVFTDYSYSYAGGMNQLLSDCDTIEECHVDLNKEMSLGYEQRFFSNQTLEEYIESKWFTTWAHIYDTETREIVWES